MLGDCSAELAGRSIQPGRSSDITITYECTGRSQITSTEHWHTIDVDTISNVRRQTQASRPLSTISSIDREWDHCQCQASFKIRPMNDSQSKHQRFSLVRWDQWPYVSSPLISALSRSRAPNKGIYVRVSNLRQTLPLIPIPISVLGRCHFHRAACCLIL